jgi:hypothetical protein
MEWRSILKQKTLQARREVQHSCRERTFYWDVPAQRSSRNNSRETRPRSQCLVSRAGSTGQVPLAGQKRGSGKFGRIGNGKSASRQELK